MVPGHPCPPGRCRWPQLSPQRKVGDAVVSQPRGHIHASPVRSNSALRTPAANHPSTALLLAGFYWEQCSGMQGLHCPRAGSPRPGTGRLWSTAAESCAFATVCATACGCSPSVPTPACGFSSPARSQSCGMAPREVMGAGVSWGGMTLHTPTRALAGTQWRGASSLTCSIRGRSRLALRLREGVVLGPPFEDRRPPQAQGDGARWKKHNPAPRYSGAQLPGSCCLSACKPGRPGCCQSQSQC